MTIETLFEDAQFQEVLTRELKTAPELRTATQIRAFVRKVAVQCEIYTRNEPAAF